MKIRELRPLKTDPSKTVTLRRTLYAKIRAGYRNVAKAIKEEVYDKDAFGLKPTQRLSFNEFWGHLSTDAQVEQFMLWLDGQLKSNLIEVDWHRRLITDSYRKGLVRAFQDTRKDRVALQNEIFFEGTKAEFLEQSFNQPETLEKVSVLFGQSFESLKGVNAAMAADIRRVLAAGLLRGDGVAYISRDLVNTVDGISARRAALIAQTEVIRAHAEGQLDAFEKLGVEELGTMVEYSTAGDGRVCPKCAAMNGKRYKVADARGIIPLHPGCRCTWIPYVAIADEIDAPEPLPISRTFTLETI